MTLRGDCHAEQFDSVWVHRWPNCSRFYLEDQSVSTYYAASHFIQRVQGFLRTIETFATTCYFMIGYTLLQSLRSAWSSGSLNTAITDSLLLRRRLSWTSRIGVRGRCVLHNSRQSIYLSTPSVDRSASMILKLARFYNVPSGCLP